MNTCSDFPGRPSILIVDDESSMLFYAKTLLGADKYLIETATSGEEAVQKVQTKAPDLMLLDLSMPTMNGLQTILACKQIAPDQRIVVISGISDPATVAQAIRLGALDYMTKPIYRAELNAIITRYLPASAKAAENHSLIPQMANGAKSEQIDPLEEDLFFLAASPAMKQIRSHIAVIAKVNFPVLLLGESGVGKEILARLIHKLSDRAQRPFIKVNCAALPAELLESEVFGHEAGAFTGAVKSKPGKFEMANHGTLLLDEIGEMSSALQAKLLHVLQDGEFSRLGSRVNIKSDVRVLAATNIDMEQAIFQKTFREDLYYRLNAFTINVPPLRERREEIAPLIQHFMERFCKKYSQRPLVPSANLMNACLKYGWPGNLRELGNFVKRYIVLRDEAQAVFDLEEKSATFDHIRRNSGKAGSGSPESGLKSLVRNCKNEAEVKAIEEALSATHWNRKLAAARLHISYKSLLNKVKRYHMVPPFLDRAS